MVRPTPPRAALALLVALPLAACTAGSEERGDRPGDPPAARVVEVRPGPWPVLTGPLAGWEVTWVDDSLDVSFPPEERYVRYRGRLDGAPVGLGLEAIGERLPRAEREGVEDGEPAGTWTVGGDRVRVWRSEVRGTTYWTGLVERGRSYLRVDAQARTEDASGTEAAWREVVGSVRLASRADLERQVAPAIVTPGEERDVVRRALAGTPLPPDLTERQVWRRADGQPLQGTGLRDWQTEADGVGEVADVVACAWWVRYVGGGSAGRRAEEQLLAVEQWGLWGRLTSDQQESLQREVDRRERTRLVGFCD